VKTSSRPEYDDVLAFFSAFDADVSPVADSDVVRVAELAGTGPGTAPTGPGPALGHGQTESA